MDYKIERKYKNLDKDFVLKNKISSVFKSIKCKNITSEPLTGELSLFKELLHFYYGRNMIEDQHLEAKLARYLRSVLLSSNLNSNVEIKV